MLIWYSNIPEETVYFLRRNTASWWYFSQFLVVGHFFVPFLLLLFEWGKKYPSFLCGMAIWILLMHLLDIYVVVLPALHITGVRPKPPRFLQPAGHWVHPGRRLSQAAR